MATTTSTSSSTSTSTTTTVWFSIPEYQKLTRSTYSGTASRFYTVVRAIVNYIENLTGVAFTPRDEEEETLADYIPYARNFNTFVPREFSASQIAMRIKLDRRPINSITSLVTKEKGDEETISTADMDLREDLGIFYIPSATGKIKERVIVNIQYEAGYASPPARAKRAIALLVQEWLQMEVAAAASSIGLVVRYSIGDYSETRVLYQKKDKLKVGMGTLLSKRAEMLLRPWLIKIR